MFIKLGGTLYNTDNIISIYDRGDGLCDIKTIDGKNNIVKFTFGQVIDAIKNKGISALKES